MARKNNERDQLDWISNAINAELSDSYNYASSELFDQQGEAWRRFFRMPYGNETDGFSQWVSPLLLNHVNDTRAFVTSNLFKNGHPIMAFRPRDNADAEAAEQATEYVNYIFRNKNDGFRFVDTSVFNAILLKFCVARVTMRNHVVKEEMKFTYKGYDIEEFEDKLATFFVANPELKDKDPFYVKEEGIEKPMDDGYVYACYKWEMPMVAERYPFIESISPGNVFVSRQAPSIEEAKMKAILQPTTITELAEAYPDAPELNGIKTKKGAEEFWADLYDSYYSWYSEREWLQKWAYDSLGFYQEQESLDETDLGVGARRVFAMDVELTADPEDTGRAQMWHIVKVGEKVLHRAPIADTQLVFGGAIYTGNRWLPIGYNDMIGQEAKEATLNTRAFTDATVQAAHNNKVVDPNQVEMRDLENLGPDDIIRLQPNAGKSGVPAVEVLKSPGPDPSVIAAVDKFNDFASGLTGVGAGFAGAKQDELADMRIDKESMKMIDNKSSLLLNYVSRNMVDFICRVHVKILDVAIRGNASKQAVMIADKYNDVDPSGMKPRADFIIKADVGINDAQERAAKVQALTTFIGMATGGGAPGPDGAPQPAIPVQLTETAGFELAKMFFEANELPGFEKIVLDPNIPQGQEQVQTVLSQIQQALPGMVQEGVQQSIQAALEMPEAQLQMANVRKVNAEADATSASVEEKAFNVANKLDAEERREDIGAMEVAVKRSQADNDYELRKRELDLKERELELREREIEVQRMQAEKSDGQSDS